MGNAKLAIRVALTVVMAWLATVLMVAGESFATSTSFHVMERLGSQEQWAIAFMVMAGVGSVGIAARVPGVRMVCGWLVSTMHGVVGLCLMLANPVSTGTGTYGVLALLGYYLVWEQAVEGI